MASDFYAHRVQVIRPFQEVQDCVPGGLFQATAEVDVDYPQPRDLIPLLGDTIRGGAGEDFVPGEGEGYGLGAGGVVGWTVKEVGLGAIDGGLAGCHCWRFQCCCSALASLEFRACRTDRRTTAGLQERRSRDGEVIDILIAAFYKATTEAYVLCSALVYCILLIS